MFEAMIAAVKTYYCSSQLEEKIMTSVYAVC